MIKADLRDTFGEFLVKLGKKNYNVVVLDSDLSYSTRTNKFAKKFPSRFFNMGIAEQNTLGTALGFAISGKIPIVSGFSIFTTGRAWEFIRFACHDNLNVKIITTHSGFVGGDGSTHNALEDLSLMSSLPNLIILIPTDNIELIKMLEFTFDTKNPFYIRLPRGYFPKIHDEDYEFLIGQPDILKDGDDICLIGTGYGTLLALESTPDIEKELKISIKIINLSSVKPINNKTLIKEIKKTSGVVTIEEHNIYCGFGSILARIISENYPMPMKFIGINESFGQSGNREKLLNFYGLNKNKITEQIRNLLLSRKR
ncbi:MAG: transketolase family protein [Promethearchaeota archaeon]|nr:MAG: transketolase family protein [Candidatus Lokiarchaeota archaeon]